MKKIFMLLITAIFLTGCGSDKVEIPPSVDKFESGQQKFYDVGTFKVGADIKERMYVLDGAGTVELSKKDKIILTENLDGRRYMLLRDGESIKIDGDLKLYPVGYAPKVTLSDTPLKGLWQYKAGSDIQAGEYQVDGAGYVEVTTGTREDIGSATVTKQTLTAGQPVLVTVKADEYLILSDAIATFMKSTTQLAAEEKARFDEYRKNNQPANVKRVTDLNMTAEQFVGAYNKLAASYDVGIVSIGNMTAQNGGFQSRITPNLQFICTTDNNLIREVALICNLQTSDDLLTFIVGSELIVETLGVNHEESGELMKRLGLTPDKIINLTEITAVNGNVKYTVEKSGNIISLTATPKGL